MEHLYHLAVTIGPRGSTTLQEREAATYALNQFEQAGLEPKWDSFLAPVSGWRPFVIAPLGSILAIFILLVPNTWALLIALLLSATTINQILAELYFYPNLLRNFVPKKLSQNVWAQIQPTEQPKIKMILVGHIDTHRTPWVFSSQNSLRFFGWVSTVGMVSNILLPFYIILLTIASLSQFESTIFNLILNYRWLILILIPIFLIILFISHQADTTPFTNGANDNASGASIVLSLAQQISPSSF